MGEFSFANRSLIGKKTGKKVKAGDKISVKTSSGHLSREFIITSTQLSQPR
jgi:allophanate hydrolase subunit 2